MRDIAVVFYIVAKTTVSISDLLAMQCKVGGVNKWLEKGEHSWRGCRSVGSRSNVGE